MPQPLQVTFCALHSFMCCLAEGFTTSKALSSWNSVGPVKELEFCSLEGVLISCFCCRMTGSISKLETSSHSPGSAAL